MTEQSGRQSRQDEVRQERRRRDDTTLDGGQALKLAIPPAIQKELAAQGRTARWVNDVGSRMHDLTVNDDWDKVAGVEPRDVVIDKSKGTTVKAHLVSKPNDFIAEDRAKKDERRRQQEDGMLKGTVGGKPLAENQYLPTDVPGGRPINRIERSNQPT
jgi:hypothetical protein